MTDFHYIHSQGGKFGDATDTSAADVDALVEQLFTVGQGKLAIHFHGGLVDKAAGIATAQRLHNEYTPQAFPVFYVWESGVWETIRNNLSELAEEPVFKQLVRKLLQYALERMGGVVATRSVLPGDVDAREVEQAVDTFWAEPSAAHIPYREFRPQEDAAGTRSAAAWVNADEIQADLEADPEFRRSLGTLPDLESGSRSLLGATSAEEHRSGFSELLTEQLSEEAGTRGIISWYKVTKLVVRILRGVLKRYASGRDHGLYATVVEEIVRGVKIGGSGLNEWGQALQWNRMKQDVRDAFGPDPQVYAGTALLDSLRRALEAGKTPEKLTLIGHSTGAIYIAEWLQAADAILPPEIKFDVIFLAPAITYERFAECLAHNGGRIRSFRSFAMRDELERDDQVWGDDTQLGGGSDLRRFIYPSSLLYLVAGILESDVGANGDIVDSPDKPLVGMQRYYSDTRVYDAADFPEVQQVRDWLDQRPDSLVWSVAQGQPAGMNCASNDHGAFDNDPDTLASIRALL